MNIERFGIVSLVAMDAKKGFGFSDAVGMNFDFLDFPADCQISFP